ncbi:OmpH family outer membrane protein [Jannaschia sp. 2305UL9-9]|uniref:OmpH family outer membrane protein n=1 Tax=Jannaschia sp. 2305UL9-9 TaxID=3121638 RepID=UPI00352762E1
MRRGLFGALLTAAMAIGGAAQSQQGSTPAIGLPQRAVVVLDRDALFAQSQFGRRVTADIEDASSALSAENRRIEAELESEEQALTERRETVPTDEFRQLASAFDTRVVGIRRAQDAKSRAIQQQSDRAQSLFFEQASPILVALAREIGALVILDRRIVIASADQVDITTLALSRIDEALGDGAGLIQPQAPERRPDVPAQQPQSVPETDAD